MSDKINAVVSQDGKCVPIKWKRERNGRFTAHIDVSKIEGIQFDAKRDAPLIELPPVDQYDSETGLVTGYEYFVGEKYELTYDYCNSRYSFDRLGTVSGNSRVHFGIYTTVSV